MTFDGDRLNTLLEAAVADAERTLEQKARAGEPIFTVARIELVGKRPPPDDVFEDWTETGPSIVWNRR